MTTTSKWLALAERARKAKGPEDFENLVVLTNGVMSALNYEMCAGVYWNKKLKDWFLDGNRIAVSLDAIVALIEKEITAVQSIELQINLSDTFNLARGEGYASISWLIGRTTTQMAATPALALVAAFCEAKAAQAKEQENGIV